MNQSTNILQKIVEQKKIDLELRKSNLPLEELIKQVEDSLTKNSPKTNLSFYDSLKSSKPGQASIIAEIKRFSPSKGPLRPDLDPISLALEYEKAGAKAISVLTEEKFFGGSDQDLQKVVAQSTLPVLRKDFTIDAYQVWEAKLLGAGAILLIAAILSAQEIKELSHLAKSLNLDVLVEVHDQEETKIALLAQPKILGVNNRNLKTFEISLETSEKIIREFQTSSEVALWVSESGIYSHNEIQRLQNCGFEAFLIGESLLKSPEPQTQLKQLLGHKTNN